MNVIENQVELTLACTFLGMPALAPWTADTEVCLREIGEGHVGHVPFTPMAAC